MSAQFLPNPFTQRGAIRDPAQFFGRQAELNQIFSCIGKMQSVSVVGERRIGKSSLLHYVCQTGQPHAPAGARLVYLDVQRVKSEEDFYTQGIALLFAGTHTLDEMIQDYWIPYFRSAVPCRVSYLNGPDARRLITNPGRSGRPHDPFRQGRAAESEGGMKQRSSMKRRK